MHKVQRGNYINDSNKYTGTQCNKVTTAMK